ncbi:unnamed protein product, partial [Ixodes pacificus]
MSYFRSLSLSVVCWHGRLCFATAEVAGADDIDVSGCKRLCKEIWCKCGS